MKADKEKLDLIMSRRCVRSADVQRDANISRTTMYKLLSGSNVRTDTIGKVASALGVDVTEIMKEA